jgi:hypothetical protein
MLTDDEVLTRLRDSFTSTVAGVEPAPDLRARVWQQHRRSVRRQRLLAPTGIALVGLAMGTAYATRPRPAGQMTVLLSTPSPTTAPLTGATVKLFDYTFTLPSGFVPTPTRTVDLGQQQPHQPVGGQSASVSATRGDQLIDITVYRGPIADAQSTVRPPRPETIRKDRVRGFAAASYSYGGGPCRTKGTTVQDRGGCSVTGSETRVPTGPHELVWVMTESVDFATIKAVLESGL